MGKVILLWSDILLRLFYLLNCQSYKAFKKIASKNSGIIFMITIISFYNYYYHHHHHHYYYYYYYYYHKTMRSEDFLSNEHLNRPDQGVSLVP